MHLREKVTDPTPCPSPTGEGSTLAEWLAIYHFLLITHHFSPLNGTKGQWDNGTFFEEPSPCLAESLSTSVQPNQRSLCSAEPTVAGRRVKQFPNSAAVSISIYNAIKSAAVSRITNPDTPCGRITNAPELGVIGEMAVRGNGSLENRCKSRACAVIIILNSTLSILH